MAWHSEKKIDRMYHYKKIKLFQKLGIHIINIFEDQWENIANVIKNKVKYEIKKTTIDTCLLIDKPIEFLKNNSINCKYNYFIGGYKNKKLVSLINCNIEKNMVEIGELINANNNSFKLFLEYIERIFNPKIIIGEIDLSWVYPESNIYTKNGFVEVEIIPLEVYKDNVWECGRIIYEKIN